MPGFYIADLVAEFKFLCIGMAVFSGLLFLWLLVAFLFRPRNK